MLLEEHKCGFYIIQVHQREKILNITSVFLWSPSHRVFSFVRCFWDFPSINPYNPTREEIPYIIRLTIQSTPHRFQEMHLM